MALSSALANGWPQPGVVRPNSVSKARLSRQPLLGPADAKIGSVFDLASADCCDLPGPMKVMTWAGPEAAATSTSGAATTNGIAYFHSLATGAGPRTGDAEVMKYL